MIEVSKRRDPIVSYLDLILAGFLSSLQSGPSSALTSSSQLMDLESRV